jgi:hypothetical protein
MLNRTLSANLNGLNLGTRTLANLVSLNIVATQGLRHAHPRKRKDSMRDMDAKMMRDSSITIRGSLEISPSMSSPFGSSYRPFPAGASPTGTEVVVVFPVGVSEPVLRTARATRAERSQAQRQPQFSSCVWRQATMTNALSIPVASTATGG